MARIKYFFIFLLIKVILQFCNSSATDKVFRGDYEYFDDMESFLQNSYFPKTWDGAVRTCMLEGASLWYPRDYCEADAVLCYINETLPQFDSIYVGISSKLAKGIFKTIVGTSLHYIYNKWHKGEPNDLDGKEDCVALRNQGTYSDVSCTMKLPFVCKKTLASLDWDDKCNVPYLGYKFSEELGKCYKLHSKPLRWRDAFAMCDAEESYLAIINSEAEAKYLKNMTKILATEPVTDENFNQEIIHVGFSFETGYDSWRTISGDNLQDAGYSMWRHGQPDGGEFETCGSMFIDDGQLNDIGCWAQICRFICEREREIPKSLKENC